MVSGTGGPARLEAGGSASETAEHQSLTRPTRAIEERVTWNSYIGVFFLNLDVHSQDLNRLYRRLVHHQHPVIWLEKTA
jgi:hypothetical protein